VQRFYVDSSTNYLTYCGAVDNFFWTNPNFNGTVQQLMAPQPSQWSDKVLQWCDAQYGCGSIQWTLTLVDVNTLTSHVLLSEPVNHLVVTFTRSASAEETHRRLQAAPAPHQCIYTPPADQASLPPSHPAVPSGAKKRTCPYMNRLAASSKALAPVSSSGFQYCYILNAQLGVTLSWNYDPSSGGSVSMQLSAPVSASQYVAIGFQPQWPFMQGADIVLGYVAGSVGLTDCVFSVIVFFYHQLCDLCCCRLRVFGQCTQRKALVSLWTTVLLF
jgi:hypothetical protein